MILIVDTEAPQVTIWRRKGESWNTEEVEGLDASVALPEIEWRLGLADLYDGVDFEAR